jgi:xanthine dehydrogenase molybdopterin-binding subunit B
MTEVPGQTAAEMALDERQTRPKNVGARVKRTEDPRLLTGRGLYVDDRQIRGALHVAFRRSDHSHARILSINTAAARAVPGVAAVFTAEDLADAVPVRAVSRMAKYYATPIQALASGKVRFVGEAVVAVVAESRYVAEDACELIEIIYDPLPVVVDPEAAMRPCCTTKRARTYWSNASSSAASSRPKCTRRPCESKGGSAFIARRPSPWRTAPIWPSTTPAARS